MKVFISYADSDKEIAGKVYHELRKKFDPFFAPENLKSGEIFVDRIQSELSSCERVIFLIGSSFFKKGSFTLTELERVEKSWNKPENRILVVLLPDTITIKDIREKSIYLSEIQILEPKGRVEVDVFNAANDMWLSPKKQPKSEIVIANYTNPQDQPQSDNPYRALTHFGPDQAKYFSGRESFVTRLAEEVYEKNFITIVGGSGLGKSSVVLAGLVPELYKRVSGKWKFTYFKLGGNNPFTELAKALLPFCDDTKRDELSKDLHLNKDRLGEILNKIKCSNSLLIIADQFEGLFTLQESSKDLETLFLDTLTTGILASKEPAIDSGNRVVLVTTLRETGNKTESALFAKHIGRTLDNLGSLSKDELNNVINKPIDGKVTISDEVIKNQ